MISLTTRSLPPLSSTPLTGTVCCLRSPFSRTLGVWQVLDLKAFLTPPLSAAPANSYEVYDVMKATEELVSGLVKHLTGSYKTTFTTQHGETYEVNWEAPWKRYDVRPNLKNTSGFHLTCLLDDTRARTDNGQNFPSGRPAPHRRGEPVLQGSLDRNQA